MAFPNGIKVARIDVGLKTGIVGKPKRLICGAPPRPRKSHCFAATPMARRIDTPLKEYESRPEYPGRAGAPRQFGRSFFSACRVCGIVNPAILCHFESVQAHMPEDPPPKLCRRVACPFFGRLRLMKPWPAKGAPVKII